MIAADYLKRIAAWSRELNERETEVARAGVVERTYRADEFIFMRGDRFDYWTGIVTGLARMGIVSRGGKATSFTGLTAGAWFGEGTVLKNEPRRYDVVALRDTRLAMMDRGTFMWLFENSVGFNRFLVGQLNERLGQFIALLEYGRTLDVTARLARGIASLFNPILYPDLTRHLEITQEEIGALSGISRQNANQCLKRLENRQSARFPVRYCSLGVRAIGRSLFLPDIELVRYTAKSPAYMRAQYLSQRSSSLGSQMKSAVKRTASEALAQMLAVTAMLVIAGFIFYSR